MAHAQTTDPLSKGPLPLSESKRRTIEAELQKTKTFSDQDCGFVASQIAASEISSEKLASLSASSVCRGRSKEIIYIPELRGIVGCLFGQLDFAIHSSIGRQGLGKTMEGDEKTPVGTYWLGYPRPSKKFGIFIPIGYPTTDEIRRGLTGSDIGIHGPARFLTCLPEISLAKDWTAGCLALGRDSQTIALSNWVLTHWPVKMQVAPGL